MRHKIIIDAISLLSPLTGIGRYTYEISNEINHSDKYKLEYFYGYISSNLIQSTQGSNLKSFIVKFPILKKYVRKVMVLYTKLFSKQYDLYWQPNFIPNIGIKANKVVTSVHDFSFILYRDFHPKERIEHFEKNFLKNIYNSDIIITGSHFTKNEILERLDFKEEQIRVIHHGINHNLFYRYDDCSVDFDLPKNFILSVGSIEPRKNLLGLLKAYNLLDEDFKSIYKLVLVGFKGWENSEVMKIIKENEKNIVYLGYISDVELAKVYNRAACFVYPSFYEGFGLPPLEAMACGIPVIASDISVIHEVCSDGALYVDPHDIHAISAKIKKLLSDKDLQEDLVKKGLQRVKQFTWQNSAKEHLRVFEEVLK